MQYIKCVSGPAGGSYNAIIMWVIEAMVLPNGWNIVLYIVLYIIFVINESGSFYTKLIVYGKKIKILTNIFCHC